MVDSSEIVPDRTAGPASNQWFLPVLVAASIGFLIVYAVLGQLGWQPATESERYIGDVSRWCERVSAGWFREPANALSNLGFMVAGLWMAFVIAREPIRQHGNQFHGLTPIAMLYACVVVWLGPGSMLMHGTHTAWGGWADNLSMVMYILLPWLINVGVMGRWQMPKLMSVYTGIVIAYGILRWYQGSRLGIQLDLFGLSIALWVISEVLYRFWSPTMRWCSGLIGFIVAAIFGILPWDMIAEPQNYWWVLLFWLPGMLSTYPPPGRRSYRPWYIAGVVSYLLAFVIWLTGRPDHPWCQPDSVIQAHAIWHLLSAIATACFFIFFRTERKQMTGSTRDNG